MRDLFARLILKSYSLLFLFSLSACGGPNSFSASNSASTAAKSERSQGSVDGKKALEPVDTEIIPEQEEREMDESEEATEPNITPNFISISCENNPEKMSLALERTEQNLLSISGEVCPNPLAENPNILFMVDVSGSMADHRNSFFGPVIKGSDPLVNGSCGRYEAIKTIISKASNGIATRGAEAALLLFSSKLNSNSIMFTDLENFQNTLTPQRVCIADGTTNYEKAFDTAQKWLSLAAGDHKIAYFISDGMPTESNSILGNFFPDAIISRSIAAGNRMLLFEYQLQFFQIFLGKPNPQSMSVMKKIAGPKAKDNIREVARASDLAQVISEFSIIELSTDNLSLNLAGSPVAITKLEETEKGASPKWTWEAETIMLPESLNNFKLEFELIHPKIEDHRQIIIDVDLISE
ncbi:MAG: VWA domain-containing protein [Oligoflexales bacterium]|nr:VWA domain-containing protein [Oligoflexales bacterium]